MTNERRKILVKKNKTYERQREQGDLNKPQASYRHALLSPETREKERYFPHKTGDLLYYRIMKFVGKIVKGFIIFQKTYNMFAMFIENIL